VDERLIGAGRAPNVEDLNLEAAGVAYDRKRGVQVNDFLQTSNSRVYAAGDICMDWKFTHAADAEARIVIKNAWFAPFGLGRARLSCLVMPWTTYTDPEVAHVGMYEREARDKEMRSKPSGPAKDVDRAVTDGEVGFVKIHHRKGSDQILGATIVARHAGEMIGEVTLAMVGKRAQYPLRRHPSLSDSGRGHQEGRRCLPPHLAHLGPGRCCVSSLGCPEAGRVVKPLHFALRQG
jgi:pyruvate/2-oxoglutarate dehydrogenase complex dihydrolipoamide dehydrogenase (E3) component